MLWLNKEEDEIWVTAGDGQVTQVQVWGADWDVHPVGSRRPWQGNVCPVCRALTGRHVSRLQWAALTGRRASRLQGPDRETCIPSAGPWQGDMWRPWQGDVRPVCSRWPWLSSQRCICCRKVSAVFLDLSFSREAGNLNFVCSLSICKCYK